MTATEVKAILTVGHSAPKALHESDMFTHVYVLYTVQHKNLLLFFSISDITL